jgi:AcrR family transcriptional regulator
MSQPRAAGSPDHAGNVGIAQPGDARQRISHAAFRLFGERGYSCTSVQDIAAAAEVQKSILYYYFGNKEGLYQTLCSESGNHLREFMLQSLRAAGLPVDSSAADWRVALPADISCEALLGALTETLIDLARENREPVRFFMAHMFAPDGDRPPVSTQEMEHITPHLVQHIVKAGIGRGELAGDPQDLERLLLGAVHYSIIRHLRSPELEPLPPGLGRHIARTVLRGFAVVEGRSVPGQQKAAARRRSAGSRK